MHNFETWNIFNLAAETEVAIYSITCLAQTSGPRLHPDDDMTSTQRPACNVLVKCPQTRSLNGSSQNPGTMLSILQHHLLVPHLAPNYLFACRPWPAVTCPFLQENHGPHQVQDPSVTINSLSHMTDTPQWHFWDLTKLLPILRRLELRLEPAHMIPWAWIKAVPAQEMRWCIPITKAFLTIPAILTYKYPWLCWPQSAIWQALSFFLFRPLSPFGLQSHRSGIITLKWLGRRCSTHSRVASGGQETKHKAQQHPQGRYAH